jgi:tetratricopeptide (TPR) repeat protein
VSCLKRKTIDRRPLLEQLPGDLKIPIHSAKFRRAEDQFRENVQRMVEIAAAANVRLLLTTPIVNLRHQSPLESLSREGMTTAELKAWREGLNRGEELLAEGQPDRALESLERTQAIDEGHALTAYRRGQSLEGLGRWREAQAAFQSACDLDACRLRAPASFARIIEDVAARAPQSKVHFLDTASAFAREIPNGIPGSESFLEHVHFTYSGNWRLALILAEEITRRVLGETWRVDRVPDQSQRDDLCGVMVQDHFVADGLILAMLERPPMNQGADVALQIRDLRSDARRLFAELPRQEGNVLGGLTLAELQSDLIGTLASGYDRAGLEGEIGVVLGRGIRRQPWRVDLLLRQANREYRQGNVALAKDLVDQSLTWGRPSAQTLELLEQLNRAALSERP